MFVLGLYFLPLIIAVGRKVPNVGSVAIINIFLGWTFIGWIVAMAMAARSAPPVHQVHVYAPPPQQTQYSAPIAPPTPAGWYTDPLGLSRLRYYDGNGWTEHVSA